MERERVEVWLETWIGDHLSPEHVGAKADMRSAAATCWEDAQAEGIDNAALKEAAGGDLETYFLRRQNAAADELR